jgi:hypothetical protein
MSNYSWVCFSCRTASRRSPVARNVRCRQCAQLCECIGYKTPVPAKLKVREWNALAESFYASRRRHLFGQQKHRVRQIHDLEREIVRLESSPRSEGRSETIKHFRKQLEQVRA